MQYRVIQISHAFSMKRAIERLEEEVKQAIALGWEPLGGVSMSGGVLLQALIKRR